MMDLLRKVTASLLLVFCFASAAVAADEAADIRALISREFDRSGAVVATDPIVIEQEYAVADWVQGEKGGRALLRKKDGKWDIMLCAGDGIRQAKSMAEAGIPSRTASALAAKLADAESRLPPAACTAKDV